RELTPHKGSASNLKYLTRVRNVNVESEQSEDSLTKRSYPDWALTKDRTRTGRSQKIAPGLGAHKKSHPDLKHLTRLEMSSPDLSEVRVRPHKRSDANLKRITLAASVSANPNVVRVQHLTRLEMSSPDLSEVRVQH
ncbi:MAG: hypothetical protein WB930_08105, partial [Syntrophobacteraceae bacterium]